MARSSVRGWFVRRGITVAALGVLAAMSAAACSTKMGPDGTTAGGPAISAIAPMQPLASAAPQTLQFSGQNFVSGLTLLGTGPSGSFTVAAGDVSNFTDTSFVVSVVLNIGTYQFTVRNPDGTQSVPFQLVAQDPNNLTGPEITAVSPATPTHNAAPQQLFVSGEGFDPNETVTLTDPLGNTTLITGPELLNVTSESFSMSATLPRTGTYSIQIMLPSSAISNTFNFKVS